MSTGQQPGILSEYPIQLDNFQGPLDLLLKLIEQRELDVTEVALAAVTDQYLAYLQSMEELDLEVASEFVVVAARLLDIKARTLLPPERPETAEEEREGDPAEELVQRLLAYRQFREVAEYLRTREEQEGLRFPRTPEEVAALESEAQLEGVTLADLVTLVDEVLRAAADRGAGPGVHEVQRERLTVADRVRRVLWLLHRGGGTITFEEMFHDRATRLEVVVTFLAVLELLRRRRIRALQREPLGPILIQSVPGGEDDD